VERGQEKERKWREEWGGETCRGLLEGQVRAQVPAVGLRAPGRKARNEARTGGGG